MWSTRSCHRSSYAPEIVSYYRRPMISFIRFIETYTCPLTVHSPKNTDPSDRKSNSMASLFLGYRPRFYLRGNFVYNSQSKGLTSPITLCYWYQSIRDKVENVWQAPCSD